MVLCPLNVDCSNFLQMRFSSLDSGFMQWIYRRLQYLNTVKLFPRPLFSSFSLHGINERMEAHHSLTFIGTQSLDRKGNSSIPQSGRAELEMPQLQWILGVAVEPWPGTDTGSSWVSGLAAFCKLAARGTRTRLVLQLQLIWGVQEDPWELNCPAHRLHWQPAVHYHKKNPYS